jgi:hypothetical protein
MYTFIVSITTSFIRFIRVSDGKLRACRFKFKNNTEQTAAADLKTVNFYKRRWHRVSCTASKPR